MQTETKQNTSGGSIAQSSEVNVDVTGFSFTPTAVLVAQVSCGSTAAARYAVASFPGGGSGGTEASGESYLYVTIVSITPGANKVTVRLRNSFTTATYYYGTIIVTAIKAP